MKRELFSRYWLLKAPPKSLIMMQLLKISPHAWLGGIRLSSLRWRLGRKQAKTPGKGRRLETMHEAKAGLSQAMDILEGNFLKVGENLEAMDANTRKLVTQCENLIHLASGGEEGEQLLQEALGVLKEPLEYLGFCMDHHERLLELLGQCVTKTEGLINIRERMHDAISPLTFMAVLFKIESAYLEEEHRVTFQTVTNEVEQLHRLVDETFAENARQLDQAHATLAGVRGRLEADFRSHAKVISAKKEGIAKAISGLDEQLARNSERDMRLHEHGVQLAQEVSAIVMGLQFQDIVKQKCDHVAEALDDAHAGDLNWGQTLALQVCQLDSIRRDLSQGVDTVSSGLTQIDRRTEELSSSSVSLENIESMTAAVDGMVQLLLDMLADVHETIRLMAELSQQGFAAVQPAGGLARDMTHTTVELSINMRLIALNAQIRSVQSGQGTGLEILASRTAEISGEINGISELLSGNLIELHQAIDEMLALFARFRNEGSQCLSLLDERRPATESRLHSMRDRTLEAVAELGNDIDRMRATTGEVKLLMERLPESEQLLGGVAKVLEQGCHEDENEPDRKAALENLAQRYTMASEREVHDAFVASQKANAGAAAQAVAAAVPVAEPVVGAEVPAAEPEKKPAATPAAPAVAPAPADNFEMF